MTALEGSLRIDWAGEQWTLLPDRALWWERRRTLVVADLHLGKAAAFRAAGIPVPEVVHAELARLESLLVATLAHHLVIVGDLIHAASGRSPAVIDAVAAWRAGRSQLAISLVRGNHDRAAGDPPTGWRIDAHDPPLVPSPDSPIAFVHDPLTEAATGFPCIGGHLHPSVRLTDGAAGMVVPCFWVRRQSMVLPAFGRFTGTRAIRPSAGERVLVVGSGAVVEAQARSRRAPSAGPV